MIVLIVIQLVNTNDIGPQNPSVYPQILNDEVLTKDSPGQRMIFHQRRFAGCVLETLVYERAS